MTQLIDLDQRRLKRIAAAACTRPGCPCEQVAQRIADEAARVGGDPAALLLRASAVLATAAETGALRPDQVAWTLARAASLTKDHTP